MEKESLLTLSELIKLRESARLLALSNNKKTAYIRAGRQVSSLRGRGIEFEEVRHYLPGDDIRTMDWRVTARTGESYTKIFREERERPVFLLVDYRASMYFGTKVTFKSVIAARAAALIAWASTQQGHCVSALIYREQQSFFIGPEKRAYGIMPLLKALVTHHQIPHIEPEYSKGALSDTFRRIIKRTRSGSLVFLISDFANFDEQIFKLFYPLRQRNDLVFIFIYDLLEKEPPSPGYYPITNGKQSIYLDTFNEKICQRYRAYFQERYQRVKQFCNKNNIRFITLTTNESLDNLFYTLEFY